MAIIKCKMCGGDIELSADKTFGTCEFCGSVMTLPKVDSDQRAASFNRGNHFRRAGEFDKALAIYEHIVQEDDTDAEAHWCCALCRFGIEYVEDPTTFEWMPTCHRASFDNFLEDVDYRAALEHSDGVTKKQYQRDAAKIAEVQRGILATSRNEEPFDVFLCYKETEADGTRTKDSTLAQEIYYQLIEQGRRVFFARITLEDKVGAEYEPYIFAALNSAKVMIVIGTTAEHFNAVWVKNEWSRFLSMMRKDRTKLLLPCYRDMDPYDLPEQLGVLQSYDMGKIGFIQDLTRGVAKVLDADKPKGKTTVMIREGAGGGSESALIKRGFLFLKDKDWNSAEEYFEKVLDQEPENSQAYYGKLLAGKRVQNADEYVAAVTQQNEKIQGNKQTLCACPEQKERIEAAVKKYTVPGYLEANKIRAMFSDYDRTYTSLTAAQEKNLASVRGGLSSDKNLTHAVEYADQGLSTTLRKMCNTANETLQHRVDAEKENDKQKANQVTEGYEAFLAKTEGKMAQLYMQALERKDEDKKAAGKASEEKYQDACIHQEQATTEAFFTYAADRFHELGEYKDSAQRAQACTEKVAELLAIEKRKEERRKEKVRKRRIRLLIIAASICAGLFLFFRFAEPAIRYQVAEMMLQKGKCQTSAELFASLDGYKDSTQKVMEAQYANAEALAAAAQYDEAVAIFTGLGEYSDSAKKAEETASAGEYAAAEATYAAGDKVRAAIAFGEMENSAAARSRSLEIWSEIATRKTVATGTAHTVALKADGTVVATGNNEYGQCNVSEWTDVISLGAGFYHTVGLKADGTVVATDYKGADQRDVSDWSDIVAVSAGYKHTVGLKSDGTVVATGDNGRGQCNVSDWSDIVEIGAGRTYTIGLKSDGTVLMTGYLDNGQFDMSGWSDIASISAGNYHAVGLKSDGTVASIGRNDKKQCDVSDWSDVAVISAGGYHTVGLKSDGTVVATPCSEDDRCDVSDWSDVVAISAGGYHTVGLKSDGTMIAAGSDEDGRCDVSDWTDIRLPEEDK